MNSSATGATMFEAFIFGMLNERLIEVLRASRRGSFTGVVRSKKTRSKFSFD